MNSKNTPLTLILAVAISSLLASVAHAVSLEDILDSPTNDWRIGRAQGAADDYKIGDVDGVNAVTVGPNGIFLTSLKPLPADTEVTVRFRLAPATNKTASVYFFSGMKNVDDPAYNSLTTYFSTPAGTVDTVLWQLGELPGHTGGDVGYYVVRSIPKDRATWPEMVRKRVEEEYAPLAPLAKHWLTLRYVIRKGHALTYLDGRMLRGSEGAGVDPVGNIRLQIYEGTQLASIRIRSLPPEDPLFETVQLDGYLNASKFKGDKVQRDSLPAAGKPATIHGVPFEFSAPDARGNDHIDVGRSWMRFGLLEGMFDGYEGETPRWRGAQFVEPGRIQLRILNGQYRELHLIAASDGEPDTVPLVTAQFYRAYSGFPVNFAGRVPLFSARSSEAKALPVKLANGTKGNLWLVTIPLDPNGLSSLTDTDYVEVELTKEVRIHRSFPDPCYYSQHGAGLPSGVHVFAVTLERSHVDIDFQPDKFAHIWTAPDKPWYNIKLTNRTTDKQRVKLELSTVSHDGLEKTSQSTTVNLAASGQEGVKLPITLKRYGHHDVELRITDETGTHTEQRSLAYLHPDTRERGGWEEGKGPLFGYWDWYGGHLTPGGVPHIQVMVAAGAESSNRPLIPSNYKPDEMTFAAANGMVTHFLTYQLTLYKDLLGVEPDLSKPAEMEAALIAGLQKSPSLSQMLTPTRLNKPEFAVMFGEPILGPISYMSLPEYYGDPPYQMTADEQTNYKKKLDEFLIMARAIKRTWPFAKIAMPWGIPSFPIAYLRNSKEATDLMDGPAIDLILFERVPEMQMHQVTYASTMWQLKQEWLKAGKKWPHMMTVEGVCASTATPGGLTLDDEADHSNRGALMLMAYGVTRHLGWPTPFRCATSWGETHYGSGMIERMSLYTPKPFYSAHATMTRQLNRMNFVKMIDTGSASVFCLQFKHYKTGELLHVFWTVRGERPVTVETTSGANVVVYDQMDNDTTAKEKDGKATFSVSTAACYVWGLKSDAKITLGTPDHHDMLPSKDSIKLANIGDGSWKMSTDRDEDYENVHLEFVKKFPGKMNVQSVTASAEQGGKALAVHLDKQEKERKTMPFYASLVPAKPVVIPGKASHIGLWVRAASDWGRVVYCLRDAKGERWVSVGRKGEWNVDDPGCYSAFCFDGWRYLRFELPGNQPYDCFRDMGSNWWGYYGKGDGIVDYPLTVEKIIVERRTHVIKADELIPANPEDVLLADLNAEYEKPADKTEEAVRLTRLHMTQGGGEQSGTGAKPKDYNPFR